MNRFSRIARPPHRLLRSMLPALAFPGMLLLVLLVALLLWHGHGRRFSTLLAGLTNAQVCASVQTTAACNGQDPMAQSCAAPEQTTVIAAEPIDTDRTAQVRYSLRCHTIWGRIIDSRSGSYSETISLDGISYHGSPRYVQGYYYTPMELLPPGKSVHLVVHPATVGRDATVSITTSGPTNAITPRSMPTPNVVPTPTRTPFHQLPAPHQGP